jgi:acetyl-CoA carboxylase biotin carboxylase subunit
LFSKILIANRGEIACRIARACRDLGVRTVAVYSDADRGSLHVRLADEARGIGPPPSSESYLRMDRILAAARESGAEAIHPGYGFLAENAEFARACAEERLTFIGPPPEALALMGNKAMAREAARKAGVPVVPGSAPVETVSAALAEAERIGYPVLVKATAGGGGKGMRRVRGAAELEAALEQARSEAASSFGDPSVYLEKYIEKPRHVEIQIVGDSRGSVVHLFERECSIQRRHQKLVEEAPSPRLDAELRARISACAVSLCREAGYQNAGTVEFLIDASGEIHFLEVNARLQVEHPVTELVTGIDLVGLQLRIASGEALPFTQGEVALRGWAMELRVTAEDPFQSFLPSAGRVSVYRPPEGPGVRHDGCLFQGQEVTHHYDPLIAKLIVAGDDRAHCLARARRSLREYRIEGIATTLPFFERLLSDERFIRGEFDVGFVDRHWMAEMVSRSTYPDETELEAALAAAAADFESSETADGRVRDVEGRSSSWKIAGRREQMGSRL